MNGVETSIDLRYNIAAFYVAVLREDIATPEQAFAVISEMPVTRVYNGQDVSDMAKLKEKGICYEEIGEIYGVSGEAVYGRIRRYKKETSSGGNQKRSNAKLK